MVKPHGENEGDDWVFNERTGHFDEVVVVDGVKYRPCVHCGKRSDSPYDKPARACQFVLFIREANVAHFFCIECAVKSGLFTDESLHAEF
ncbi:MAG: hypothetical protein U5L75_01195 [Candidatus Campbellbacteria bacterium]|nr:hypothetical protein [Candidatus Campbellbacteria bacterium]